MKNLAIQKVLLLGSGALKIGQAGEFDYSGGQLGCVTAKTVRSEFAIVTDPCRVPKFTKPGYLLNLSYAPLTVPGAAVFDMFGKKVAGDTIPEGGGARVKP